MKLSEENKKKISAWFRENRVKQSCLVCPNGKYALLSTLLTLPIINPEDGIDNIQLKDAIPFIMSQCTVCGHTQLFAFNETMIRD